MSRTHRMPPTKPMTKASHKAEVRYKKDTARRERRKAKRKTRLETKMSKGSRKRPITVSYDQFEKNWESIFGDVFGVEEPKKKDEEGWEIVYEDSPSESCDCTDEGTEFFWSCRERIEEELEMKVEFINPLGNAHQEMRIEADAIVKRLAKRAGARLTKNFRDAVGYGQWKPGYKPGGKDDPFPVIFTEQPETD